LRLPRIALCPPVRSPQIVLLIACLEQITPGAARAGHASLMRPMGPLPANRSRCCRYAMVRTDTTAVVAAFNPGGVMQYLPGCLWWPSREEIGIFYIGPKNKYVKAHLRRIASNAVASARHRRRPLIQGWVELIRAFHARHAKPIAVQSVGFASVRAGTGPHVAMLHPALNSGWAKGDGFRKARAEHQGVYARLPRAMP
jgi:hypothetical protein